jgi:16S rRNA (adenine1518-N6/adenine1519-N6)-dimethyltransferase
MELPKKSLGQYWLNDTSALEAIAEAAEIKSTDSVLEVGPGLGSLTHYLVRQAQHVIAVELDQSLVASLPIRVPAKNLRIVQADILKFDLSELPGGYKVVANIPYYLTSNLLRVLAGSSNPPTQMVLLVQKEVAQRICAEPGQMNLLAVSVQLYYDAELGVIVPAKLFTPPPKVDSEVVILRRHVKPLFKELDSQKFFQVVKAGFSGRRKKLRSSLSAGLQISKGEADQLLQKAGISGDLRAQNLNLQDWHSLYEVRVKPLPPTLNT